MPGPDATDSAGPESAPGPVGQRSCPTAPATPTVPWITRPSTQTPAPMPVPTMIVTTLRAPAPPPKTASPAVAA